MDSEKRKKQILIDPFRTIRDIKLMNAVNNGPKKGGISQVNSNFTAYKALEIPYARLHDAAHCSAYGAWHSVDITCIFPDFSKDPDNPDSYDFTLTDEYLSTIREAGTEPFFRLGQSIEHWSKKYGVNPPADNEKWASICEHIIRHFNEGWANGFHWNLMYWEIWNEPDLANSSNHNYAPTWTGTKEQFFELFKVTALKLKKAFPNLKIGGPALAYDETWADDFLKFLKENNVDIDFFSWHVYRADPRGVSEKAFHIHALLDKYGFTNAESILNEWNYVRGWQAEWIYSLQCESGDKCYKGAAFISAVMSLCQDAPVDMLMFYDARIGTAMNNMFATRSLDPLKGYYPFVAWKKLRKLGTQIAADVSDFDDIFVTAATNQDGKFGILVTRFNDDDNICTTEQVTLRINGKSFEQARFHMTDEVFFYSEIFPECNEDGSVTLNVKPNAFVFIELD